MKRTIFFLMAALTLLSSCEVHHFMTDSSYRAKVEADLQKRLEPERLKARFAVDKDSRRLTESDGFVSDPYLTTEEFEALEFLYAYMPLADLTDYSTGYYLQNVRASFTARNEMGWNVPEREFRHFVLPIRANNENLDTSRVVFYRELKPRIEGMSMQDAILEVNHWCHEKLTYKPSDARTLSPLSSVVSSLGRCGEESTFTVAALRAVGIPARQVYTPRWAHTDDNHAWVEAWADGKWYFLGACEPEPVLDLGWFNSPASRGLLMHTRVFGSYDAPEAILCPRVENEFLSAYKSFFARSFGTGLQKEELLRPANLIKWVNDSITMLRDPKAWSIPMSPAGVYQARMADARSRNIFFVALARTLGLDARKDPVTGKIQYKDAGQWVDVDFEASSQVVAPTGTLVLNYEPTAILANPYYYSHFTISKIENGRTRLLTFDEGQVDMGGGVSWANIFKKGTPLDVGDYVLVSGNRLSDGSVPVTMRQFSVREGETTTLDLRITIPEDRLSVIGSFDAETRYCMEPDAEPVSVLSTTGRGFYVIGFLTPRQEPSVHAINDLIAAKSGLEAWGRPILLLTTAEGLGWLKEYSASLPSNIHLGIIPDGLDLKDRRMPYFLLADTFNRVFFTTEGYTIGLGDQLVTAIAKL